LKINQHQYVKQRQGELRVTKTLKLTLLVLALGTISCSSLPSQKQDLTAQPEVTLTDSTVDKVDASVNQETKQQVGSSGEATSIGEVVTETYNGLTTIQLLLLVFLAGILIPRPKFIKLLF